MAYDVDYSQMRGIADEQHWNEFVLSVGGELVAPLIKRQGVKNADYIFRSARVVAELKIIETEIAHSNEMLAKVNALIDTHPEVDPDDPRQPLFGKLFALLRAPLQRIVKKANRQIKETKAELRLADWRGVMICVNDNFRGVSPGLANLLFSDILAGSSYRNTDAFIYQTNHFVELAETPYAILLWTPLYRDHEATPELCEFVNDLGRKWRSFASAKEGPYDISMETEFVDLSKAEVVTGRFRKRPFNA